MYGHPKQGYMPGFKPQVIRVYEKSSVVAPVLRSEESKLKPQLPPHVSALMSRIVCEGCE